MNFLTVASKHLIKATSLEELHTSIVADIKQFTGAREVTVEFGDAKPQKKNKLNTIVLTYEGKGLGQISYVGVNLTRDHQEELEVLCDLLALKLHALQHTEFLSYASHEIRNPLTSISGYIQLIDRKLAQKESINVRWVKALIKEVNRLELLVKKLLAPDRA